MKKGKISQEFLQKVKDSVNLVEVIGEHVVLRKSGANYVGLCPFHSERSPSFSVSENKQLYHCYGCKKGGDLVTFVMEILGVSFPEAVEELADRARVPLPKDWVDQSSKSAEGGENEKLRFAQREKQNLAYKLNRFVAAYFHQTLDQYSIAKDYLHSREVQESSIQTYYAGASTDSWDGLAHHLQTKAAPMDMAVELGLLRPSPQGKSLGRGTGYFDLFRNRVIFPILNLRGKVVGFGGRILQSDQTPKYLNSPESFIFHKSKLAFGLFQAQKHIREQDEVILVEGYFDVLALQAAGFKNVVATCGTSLTADHLTLFKRFANRVTVLFDGDQAGISATERAMEIGLDFGLVLYGAQMPPGLDPDEVILSGGSNGKEKMATILQEARPLLDAKIDEALVLAGQSSEDRTQALKKIGGWLKRFKDPIGREVRIQTIQKELGLTKQLVEEVTGKSHFPTTVVSHRPVPRYPTKVSLGSKVSKEVKMSQADKTLLAGVIFGGKFLKLFAEAKNSLPPQSQLSELFEYGPAREFISTLLVNPTFPEGVKVLPGSLEDGGGDAQVRALLTEVLVSTESPVSEDEFRGALHRGIEKNWARFSQYIKTAITNAELKKDAELQTQLMKEYLDVQRKMKEFSSFYDEE